MSASTRDQGWEQFKLDCRERHEGRERLMVPVLGTGFRRWLLDGLAYPDGLVDWKALLAGVAHCAGVPRPRLLDHGSGFSLAWEEMVSNSMEGADKQFAVRENHLARSFVTRWLNVQVARHENDPDVMRKRKAFWSLCCADVVDLSFDGLLVAGEPVIHESQSLRNRKPKSESFKLSSGSGTRRIVWHPHGTTRSPKSLVLGVQRYGRQIAGMIAAFASHKAWEKEENKASRPIKPLGEQTLEDLNAYRFHPSTHDIDHWIAKTINAPLLLLGVGAGPDEWDLWWYIQMRCRNHMKRVEATKRQGGTTSANDAKPRVFRLTCEDDKEACSPVLTALGVLTLHGGKTWDEAWDKLFTIMTRTTPD